jgi:hypothetical protein
MNPMTDARGPRQLVQEINGEGTLREEMEATARAHLAADNAQVDEAMGSVRWERRGLLQRLTRGSR